MTNHTPGPWIIDEQYIVAGDDEVICQWGSYSEEANARLIAAAPDMFEEIKRLRMTDNDLYYLQSILRQLREFQSLIADGYPSDEVLADNVEWLDGFVSRGEKALTGRER